MSIGGGIGGWPHRCPACGNKPIDWPSSLKDLEVSLATKWDAQIRRVENGVLLNMNGKDYVFLDVKTLTEFLAKQFFPEPEVK